MDDERIRSYLLDMGRYPGDPRPFGAAEVRELCARVEAGCVAAVMGVAERYRPVVDRTVDHQAQIARNAALSCAEAIKAGQS